MKAVYLEAVAVSKGDISLEPITSQIETIVYDNTTDEDKYEHIGDAEVVFTNKVAFDRETFEKLPKKEVVKIKKEMEKLQRNIGGVKEMKKLPDMIFVVDPRKEHICIQEAHTLGIPIVGIADTNCDPEELDYVIPGNDDAIRAVKLIVSKLADAVIEANQGADAESEAAAEAAEAEATEE